MVAFAFQVPLMAAFTFKVPFVWLLLLLRFLLYGYVYFYSSFFMVAVTLSSL